ncbi:hypothetical protein ACOMHN_051741 [Nucella lapillus]
MYRAVWASYFHVTSTDEEHNHLFCQEGSESWCFFQRATADGVAPRPHTKSLPLDVAEAIRPVYERLSDRTLLSSMGPDHRIYREGQRFKSADGCNTCACSENGGVFCTEMACVLLTETTTTTTSK